MCHIAVYFYYIYMCSCIICCAIFFYFHIFTCHLQLIYWLLSKFLYPLTSVLFSTFQMAWKISINEIFLPKFGINIYWLSPIENRFHGKKDKIVDDCNIRECLIGNFDVPIPELYIIARDLVIRAKTIRI